MFREFKLTPQEYEKGFKWYQAQMAKAHSIDVAGARFRFSFVPSGIGTSVTITDIQLGDSIDLTDYNNW